MTKANARKTAYGLNRRRLLKAGVALGALQLAAPFILSARGEEPVKIGMVNPLTGILSALAQASRAGPCARSTGRWGSRPEGGR